MADFCVGIANFIRPLMTLLATAFIACFSGNIASAKDVHIQKAQLPCDAFIRGSLDTSAYFQKLSRLQAELKRMHPDLVVEPDYDVEEAGYQGLAVFRGNKCLGSLYYVALSREKMMKGRTKIYGSRNQGQYLSLWLNVEMLLRHPQTKIIETKLIQDNEKILGSFTEGDSENLETAFFLTPAGKTYLRLGFDALTNLSTEDDPNHFEVSRP